MKKAVILVIVIYILFTVACLITLGSHYVTVGECAVITYYQPLTWLDRTCFILLGAMAWIISRPLIPKDMKHRKILLIIIGLIYVLSAGLYVVYGNEMLGAREMDWPHHYKVQPITSIIADKNIASNSDVC